MEDMSNEIKTLVTNDLCVEHEVDTQDTKPEDKIDASLVCNFSISESVYAWICLFLGYAFCRAIPIYANPLGAFILIVGIFTVAAIIIKLNSGRLSINSIIIAMSAIIVNLSLILSANKSIHTVSFIFFIFAFTYFIYSAFNNNIDGNFSNLMLIDVFKSSFVMPFASFGKVFVAMFSKGNKNTYKSFLKIILGLIITIIPTIVVTSLLSFDKDFANIIENIFSFDLSNTWGHIGSLILGIPVSMYIFGLYVSSANKKCESINKTSCENSNKKAKFLPCITACSAVVPILVIYVIYFVSQFKYFCSAFASVLPENFSYAEYARAGFFQLLAVTIINALIILSLVLFSKRNSKVEEIALKVTTVLFCIATLILVCSALSKMIMYIDIYGLTPKRVYTSWFMIMISLVVVTVIVKQFVHKFKVVPVASIICVIMVAVLSLVRVDAFIAKYNVDRYINNTLPSVDIELLDSLSEDSIEHMVKLKKYIQSQPDGDSTILYKSLDEKLTLKAKEFTANKESIFEYSIPRFKAKKALKSSGYFE